MKTIMLGKNGPQVSRIGLGCVGMSDLYGSKETRNAKEIIATIDTAVEQGINFFDTGDYYGMGHNELLLREAMRGRRDKFFIFGSSLAYLTSIDKVEDGGADNLWQVSLGSMGRFQDLSPISYRKWKDYEDGCGPNRLLKNTKYNILDPLKLVMYCCPLSTFK